MLFKDSGIIKNPATQQEALERIAILLNEASKSEDREQYLKEKLLNGMRSSERHYPSHDACKGFQKPKKGCLKEKRICHCMYYYMQNPMMCERCSLDNKWKNIGKIKVTEFELPMMHVYPKVGGIDVILDETFAVEVKPPDSSETLARMIAEILTYTVEPASNGKRYLPAIGFFDLETNKQRNQFLELVNNRNEYLRRILEDISVFFIHVSSLENPIIEYSFKQVRLLEEGK